MAKVNTLLISFQEGLDGMGIKYLHYYLLKNGYNSLLLNLPAFDYNDDNALEHIRKFILETGPKFIGMSLMSHEYFSIRDLTKYLKNHFESIPIIWGGIHPTISPETCVGYADYVCTGEGERSIIDMASAISRNADAAAVNNICCMEEGRIRRNPLYPLIENLDEIPSYDHIPVNNFIQKKNGLIAPVDKKIFKQYARYRGTIYNVMSSRGCPFSCTYCCNNFISKLYQAKKIRRRSIENIISELEKAVNDNPEIEYINFHDDCFLACSDNHLREFCKIYKEKIKKPFIARSIPTYITRDKIKSLKDAGLSWISLGLQSGSDRVCRDVYKRQSLKEDFLKAAEIIKDYDIAAFYDVILDNPFETEEDRLETVQTFIETPKPFYPVLLSLSFYLKTELYEKAKEECPGKIEDFHKKNIQIYNDTTVNKLTRLAAFLDKKLMSRITRLYKQNSAGLMFKTALFTSNLFSAIIFEPLTFFQVIKLSQRGSYMRTLKVLPSYFREGFTRYLNRFKARRT